MQRAKTRSTSKSADKPALNQNELTEAQLNESDADNSASDNEPEGDAIGLDLSNASMDDKLNFLCREISEVKKLKQEVSKLKKENREKDFKIQSLQTRVQDLEQYTRMDDLVINGLTIPHRSFARVARNAQSDDQNDSAPVEEQHSLEEKVVEFLNNHAIPIDSKDISACHTLGKGGRSGIKPIVLRFVNRKTKIDILRKAKATQNLKDEKTGEYVYINEHLAKANAVIARQARMLKKQGKIVATWTRNCKIFVKTSEDNEHFEIRMIRTMEDLSKYN